MELNDKTKAELVSYIRTVILIMSNVEELDDHQSLMKKMLPEYKAGKINREDRTILVSLEFLVSVMGLLSSGQTMLLSTGVMSNSNVTSAIRTLVDDLFARKHKGDYNKVPTKEEQEQLDELFKDMMNKIKNAKL